MQASSAATEPVSGQAPAPSATPTPTVQTRTQHLYTDEAGTPLAQVTITLLPNSRTEVKAQAVRPDGGFARTLGRVRRVLYHLPRVIDALGTLAPVFIVPDEQAADALAAHGLVATTCPLGLNEWQDEHTQALTGANVVLVGPVPDGLADKLKPVANTVRTLTLPDRGDKETVVAWLNRHTREEFLDAARTQSPRASSAALLPVTGATYPPPTLDEAARHGLFGEILDLLEPSTEAEPAAVLVSLLVGFGVMCGAGPVVTRGPEKFPAKTFAVIVGASAKARKGTSWSVARSFLARVDDDFFSGPTMRQMTGLSSGEGLIARVRDDTPQIGHTHDPRCFVIEAEWGKVLRVSARQGNTLSSVYRECWDCSPLGVATKNDAISSSSHHIGIIGHITAPELRAELDTISISNGLANRHLWVFVERTKVLAEPPDLDEVQLGLLASRMRAALTNARSLTTVPLSRGANRLWADLYPEIESRDPAGIVGDLTSRGTSHILRLALIYALADQATEVSAEHMLAAKAVWDYSEASVFHLFGDRLSDNVAQRLLEAVRQAGDGGLTSRQVFAVFSGNITSERIQTAIQLLERHGLAHQMTLSAGTQGGRPTKVLVPGVPR